MNSKTARIFIRAGRQRGFTLIYAILMMTALLGFTSLAVDFARVQMAKTKLLYAADAAARAACLQISNGTAAIKNAAVTWGGRNDCDGSSVVIDPNNDVEIGVWDAPSKTFTVTSTNPNAVRVTARRASSRGTGLTLFFGNIFGSSTCDAKSSVIACATSTLSPGIVGINSMSLNQGSSGYLYSYDSSVNTYSAAANNSKATVASNGIIYLNNAYIYGDIKAGVGQSYTYGGSGNVISGSQGYLTTSLSYSAAAVGSFDNTSLSGAYYNGTDITINSGTISFPAGSFSVRNFSMNGGTINCAGVTTIYVTGNLTIGGGTTNAYLRRPGNLKIYMVGSGSMSMSFSGKLEADVYGPAVSATLVGSSRFAGRIIVGSLSQSGNNILYQDTSLSGIGWGSGGTATSVR